MNLEKRRRENITEKEREQRQHWKPRENTNVCRKRTKKEAVKHLFPQAIDSMEGQS